MQKLTENLASEKRASSLVYSVVPSSQKEGWTGYWEPGQKGL